ncbi:MAG: iron ABC transporter permease [Bacteroidetes bacterium]|nr:iron ABC transporter permease [Bacteroidota bacterium]
MPDISIIKDNKSKHIKFFVILILLLIVLFFLDLVLGSVKIPIKDVFSILTTVESSRQEWLTIVIDFRLPKAITAVIAGAALSVSGLQMQTIFRNPLAGPYVLGISSGASLGVAILVLGFSSFFTANQLNFMGNWAVVVSACIGSGLILFFILTLSFRISDIMTILILGILFGSAATAVVSILQYFSNESMLKAFIVWTMGSLGSVSHSQLNILLPCIVVGLLISLASTKILNAMLLGESYAKSMGVNIKTSRILVFISTSILAGTITAFCGPIGFIGIAVPHLTRILFKTTNHNFLIPGSILMGAIIMLISDIISRLPGYNTTLPINSVTALLGIPIVILIIVRKQKLSSLM